MFAIEVSFLNRERKGRLKGADQLRMSTLFLPEQRLQQAMKCMDAFATENNRQTRVAGLQNVSSRLKPVFVSAMNHT